MSQQEILTFIAEHKIELAERFGVQRIGLFGSYARNSQTANSDIDLLVSMPSNFDLYYDLKEYLESAFQTSVDLGLEKTIRPLVRSHIEKEILYV